MSERRQVTQYVCWLDGYEDPADGRTIPARCAGKAAALYVETHSLGGELEVWDVRVRYQDQENEAARLFRVRIEQEPVYRWSPLVAGAERRRRLAKAK